MEARFAFEKPVYTDVAFWKQTYFFVCFVDRTSRYNRVKKSQHDAQLIPSIFHQHLHVSDYLGPSSGGTTVCIQQLVLVILVK